MSRDTRRRKFVPEKKPIEQVTYEVPENAMMWPGTTVTPYWGVQWVNIADVPEWYVSPTLLRQQRNKWRLYARYEAYVKEWWDSGEFMDKISQDEKKQLNEILTKQIEYNNQPSKIYQAPEYSRLQDEATRWYLKQKEQIDIANSDQGIASELWTAVIKWWQWLAQWLEWMWSAIREKVVPSSEYDPNEVAIANSYKPFGENKKYDVEREQPFDMTDLWTQRFWVNLAWWQAPYFVYWWWSAFVTSEVTWSLARWVSTSLLKKELTKNWWIYANMSGWAIWSVVSTAFINWGDTYNSLIEQWATPEEASKWASEVFNKTLLTSITEVPQFISVFSKTKVPLALRTAWVMGTEAWEETVEEWIQEDVQSKILTWEWVDFSDFIKTPQALEAWISWAFWWVIFSWAWEVYNKLTDYWNKQSDTLIDYAKRWDDTFLDQIDYLMIKWEVSESHWNELKKIYLFAKDYLLKKAEPIVDKIAEKTWAKMNFIEDIGADAPSDIQPSKYEGNLYRGEVQWEQNRNLWDFYSTEKLTAERYAWIKEQKWLWESNIVQEKVESDNALIIDGTHEEIFKKMRDQVPELDSIIKVLEENQLVWRNALDPKVHTARDDVQVEWERLLIDYAKERGFDTLVLKNPKEDIVVRLRDSKKIDKAFNELAGQQEAKATMWDEFKDSPEFAPKKENIDYLVQTGYMKDTGESYVFTEKAIKEYNIGGENSSLPYLKVGLHYPKSLYKKVEQQKVGREERRVKNSRVNETAKKIRDAKVTDVANLIKENGADIVKSATEYALKKNMISKETAKQFINAVENNSRKPDSAPTGRLSSDQKLKILDMIWYDKVFKKIEQLKIKTAELYNGLKNIWGRLHLINAPEWQRVRLPFSLMGNKSATFRNILLPLIQKATGKWAEVYIEPYGWAGTVYYFADEMFRSGIKEMHINHFDNEKFIVLEAIKSWELKNISSEVTEAFDTIIWDIWLALADIPEIRQIMDEYWVQIGTKEFKELAQISFFPKYAKQFFEERPDTKLAIKWETTSSFKEWLWKHLAEEAKKAWKELKWKELQEAVDIVLSDSSVFENNYPKISKRIVDILNEYENMDISPWDYKQALLVAMSRHFRQRGNSYQNIVSAASWFQDVMNAVDKMIDGLSKYKSVFQKHWDKIHIYNQDGKEFISDMWKSYNNEKTISYMDPPYVWTTRIYIKNQPKEIQESLWEYANPENVGDIFSPLKDSMMMFTNDIDGKYFESLDWILWDRMSKDIIGYREGTTPTSLVTSTELSFKPKDLWLQNYQIIKDSFIKDIIKWLNEWLLPKISGQQRKIIAKFEQHFEKMLQEKFWDLTKIQEQQYKWKEAFEKLKDSLSEVISWKDKQRIIREAKKWLKQNIVTGSDVVKMIDEVNRLWENKNKLAKELRTEIDNTRKSWSIDVESKKMFFDWFNENYTEKKVPQKMESDVEIVDRISNWWDFTKEEFDVYEKYLTDPNFYDKIELARKKSIYNLDIEELNTLLDTVKYYQKVGKDYRKFKEQEFDNQIEEERVRAESTVKSIDTPKLLPLSEQTKKWNRLISIWINAKTKTKEALLDATPGEWVLDEELNISRTIYNLIEKPMNKYRDEIWIISEEFDALSRKLKITKEGWEKISIHWLARRSDWKWKIKLIARMKKWGEDPETFSEKLEEFASDTYLTKEEKEMYDFMQDVFKKLWKEMQKTKILVDNEMVNVMDEYFPIMMDWNSNQDKFTNTVDPNTIDNGSQIYKKVKTKQWFTKEATWLEVVPELNSEKIFKTHVNNVSYYTNMQKPIKQLNILIEKLWKEKLWELGYKYMKDYVDLLARQWILWVQTWFDRAVSAWVRNFQTAVLWYNPTTVVLQGSAIFEAMAIWGTLNLKAYYEVLKIVAGKRDVWDMISQKSWVIRNREYRNLFGNASDKFDKWILEKWNKYWFYWIQKADAVISRIVWYTEYQRSIKQWLSEADAIYNADTIVKKSMWHTHFEGKSMFVLKNERKASSVATVFQNFVLNHSAILRYSWGKNVKKKYWKVLWFMYAMLFAWLLFWIYEALVYKWGREVHNQEDYSSPLGTALWQIIGMIPYVSIVYWSTRFQSLNVLTWWKDIMNWFDYWDPTRIIKWLATIMWIWGTAEFDKIYKWYIKEEKKKSTTTSWWRESRTREADTKWRKSRRTRD